VLFPKEYFSEGIPLLNGISILSLYARGYRSMSIEKVKTTFKGYAM
jgi:hypothetical protein